MIQTIEEQETDIVDTDIDSAEQPGKEEQKHKFIALRAKGQDATATPPTDPLAETYAILQYAAPAILKAQGKNMFAFLEVGDSNTPPAEVTLGDYTLNIRHGLPTGRGGRGGGDGVGGLGSTPISNSSPARFVVCSGTGEYWFVGGPMSVTFTPRTANPQTVRLGSFDESMYVDGRWVAGRRLNGDETDHDRRWPNMGSFGVYCYRIYQRD
jgi:hypothetical protein